MDLLNKVPTPFEPKMINRWMINFPKEFNIGSMVIHKTSRPEFEYNLFGKKIYKPIDIYLYDIIGPSTAQGVNRMVEQLEPKSFLEKLFGVRKKFNYKLQLLDPTGFEIERWSIDCKIKGVEYGELDYSNLGVVKIKVTVKPTKVNLIF